MTSNNPWAEIPVAETDRLARIRVTESVNHRIFWFRDEINRRGLLVEIPHNLPPDLLKKAKINIRDITVDIIAVPEEGIKALLIRLEEHQNRDVFLKLCLDLIERAISAGESENIFHVICGRLKKWQSLLSGRAKTLLSSTEIQGLYAELFFLGELLANNSQEEFLIKGWEGPERTQHDFILGDKAVEIKSIAGNQRGKVRISSEDQLDTHLNQLYLRTYFLSELQEGDDAESLNAIVRRITAQLTEKTAKALFELKLETVRYLDIPDYDAPLFRVKDCRTYLVTDVFPRITRKDLPEGIEAVSYDLVLAGIEKFRTNDEILEK